MIWHVLFPFGVLFAVLGSAVLTGYLDSRFGRALER